ncbi:hypothetical protein H311_03009, partial [Anncaliia algerae PRA109]
ENNDEDYRGINTQKKPRISKEKEFSTDTQSKISFKETNRYELESNTENSFEGNSDIAFFGNDMHIYKKDFSKTKLIKILTQLSQNQKTFTTNCMNKFINLLRMSQLPCSLGIFVNFAYYFSSHVDKNTLLEEAKRYEFCKYFNFLAIFMSFFSDTEIDECCACINNDTLTIMNKEYFTKEEFDIFICDITSSYNEYCKQLEKITANNFNVIQKNHFYFIEIPNSDIGSYSKKILDIIFWFEKSIFYYFCNSEFLKIKQDVQFKREIDIRHIYAFFVFLHYYGMKIMTDNNVSDNMTTSNEDFKFYRENHNFAKDLLYFKFMLRYILVKYIRIDDTLASYYKTINFFIFFRVFFNNYQLFMPNLDIWLMNININEETIFEFQIENLKIQFKKNFQTLNEYQKKIFITLFLRSRILHEKHDKYNELINSIGTYNLTKFSDN